jgi:hypothetical protein
LKHLDHIPLSEQDDFFLKIWPDEKPEVKEPQTDSSTVARITTADNIVDGGPKVKIIINNQ